MKNQIISAWGSNVNDFYDPERSGDGGGYFQPCGGCVFSSPDGEIVVEVDDTSCGDFGTRYSAAVWSGKFSFSFCWGSMEDISIDSDEEMEKWLDIASDVLDCDVWDLIQQALCASRVIARENL